MTWGCEEDCTVEQKETEKLRGYELRLYRELSLRDLGQVLLTLDSSPLFLGRECDINFEGGPEDEGDV